MKRFRYIISLFIITLPITIPISCQFAYWYRLINSRLVSEPYEDIEKMAEYFYHNPPPFPNEIDGLTGDINSELCAYGSFARYSLIYGISWIVNGTRLPDWMFDYRFYDNDEHHSCLNYQFQRWLYPGYHLIEIYWQLSPFIPGQSYQFGVKVNDVLATPIPQTP